MTVEQIAYAHGQMGRVSCEPNGPSLSEVRAASGMSAGTAETTQIGSGPQDRQPDGEAGTPKGHPEQPR